MRNYLIDKMPVKKLTQYPEQIQKIPTALPAKARRLATSNS